MKLYLTRFTSALGVIHSETHVFYSAKAIDEYLDALRTVFGDRKWVAVPGRVVIPVFDKIYAKLEVNETAEVPDNIAAAFFSEMIAGTQEDGGDE